MEEKIYNAETAADVNASGAQFSGVLSGDEVTIVSGVTGTFNSPNVADAATVTLEYNNVELGGAAGANYVLASTGNQATVTAGITPKALKFIWPTESDRTFIHDGNKKSVVVTNVEGLADSDLKENLTLVYADNEKTEVGKYTAKVTGAGNTNYTVEAGESTASCGWSIAKNTYTLTASPATLNFGSIVKGSAAPVAQTVTVTNTGNTKVTLIQPMSAKYTIGNLSEKELSADGGTATFTVQPNPELDVGEHNEAITVATSVNTSVSVQAKFTVVPVTQKPTITGAKEMRLPFGYVATSTNFVVTGIPTPTTELVNNDSGFFKWNNNTLGIPTGLKAGHYTIRIKAENSSGKTWFDFELYVGDAKLYSVSYLPGANGGGAAQIDKKTQGEPLALRGAIFKREGFSQTGWATSDGGGKAYGLGESYEIDAEITLYPVWTVNPPTPAPVVSGQPTQSTIDLSNMKHVKMGVNEFIKALRELNPKAPKSFAYPNGTTLVINLSKLPNGGVVLGETLDYSMLGNSGITTISLHRNGVSVELNVNEAELAKPERLNVVTGGGDLPIPAGALAFEVKNEDFRAYIEGISAAAKATIPVKTAGPYAASINGKSARLNVGAINGKKVVSLTNLAEPKLYTLTKANAD